MCTGAAVCFVVWVPKLNGHEGNIDEATTPSPMPA
jgi:hypothetical protein